MKKAGCAECVFRTRPDVFRHVHTCDYSYLMDKPRKVGEPPEKCTSFIRGERVETPEQAQRLYGSGKPAKRAFVPRGSNLDISLAEKLYAQGMSDQQIAEKTGVNGQVVWYWRKRTGRPANTFVRGRGEAKRAREVRMKKEAENHAAE